MRYVPFGSNAVEVSEVILGTMRIGGMTPREVATLIETAVESGVNAVDTAPIYGPSGRLIGEALSLCPGLRDQLWLQTKLGIRHHPRVDANYFDFSYEHIIESVDARSAVFLTYPSATGSPEKVGSGLPSPS